MKNFLCSYRKLLNCRKGGRWKHISLVAKSELILFGHHGYMVCSNSFSPAPTHNLHRVSTIYFAFCIITYQKSGKDAISDYSLARIVVASL